VETAAIHLLGSFDQLHPAVSNTEGRRFRRALSLGYVLIWVRYGLAMVNVGDVNVSTSPGAVPSGFRTSTRSL
jgi:hypothetical protein